MSKATAAGPWAILYEHDSTYVIELYATERETLDIDTYNVIARGFRCVVRSLTPFPLALSCPRCHQQHVDEGEWATKPHSTHTCVAGIFGPGCGATWKPADAPTVGVVRSFELDDMEHTPGGSGQR